MDTTQITFNGIRADIVDYLQKQDTFKDYNFTAPGISTLIDALAYTSHYLVRYANFAINECFLDSAQLRHNVISQAKQIGYIPYQWKAAKANITLKSKYASNISDLSGVKVNTGTMFSGHNEDGISFIFRTTKEAMFKLDESGYFICNLEIVEGTFLEDSYTQDELYTTHFYLLNNEIDLDYLTVNVYESESDNEGEQYYRARYLSDFGKDARIYYIQEGYNDKLEIYFGDGKISKKLEPYNIVKVNYLYTHGPEANNIARFYLLNSISGHNIGDFDIIVNEPSSGGAEKESIESIKMNAPKFYQAQDRAVTIQDYNALLMNEFGGWLKSVMAWGGENDIPPRYGEVLICCLGKYSDNISPRQKEEIKNYLENRNLPDITVVLLDPDPMYVDARITVDWRPLDTTVNKDTLLQQLRDTITNHFEMNISSFDTKLRYSQLLIDLTSVNKAIDDLLVTFTLKKMLKPDYKITTNYTFNFMNPILPTSVIIGPWTNERGATYTISDYVESKKEEIEAINDSTGILWMTKSYKNGYNTIEKIGKVDYTTGEIYINTYQFDPGVVKNIPVVVSPDVLNIQTAKNGILKLNEVYIDIEELM